MRANDVCEIACMFSRCRIPIDRTRWTAKKPFYPVGANAQNREKRKNDNNGGTRVSNNACTYYLCTSTNGYFMRRHGLRERRDRPRLIAVALMRSCDRHGKRVLSISTRFENRLPFEFSRVLAQKRPRHDGRPRYVSTKRRRRRRR